MNPLTVEFEITDLARFESLRVVFNALREAKTTGAFTEDHSGWLSYFDNAARATFWWPTGRDPDEWRNQRRWDFESMVDAFANGEYDLGECERVNETTGRLTFFEHAYPFGGTGCMRALIESFGHRVTRNWDGTTPPPTAEDW